MNSSRDKLGPPDVSFHELQIWIHGRQFPDSHAYWDGNWLNVTVHCGAKGADVWASGTIIHLSHLQTWLEQTGSLHGKLSGKAFLDCMEPDIYVEMKIGKRGQVCGYVRITPDIILQDHTFKFEVDQTYLPPLMKQLDDVLEKFPIRDSK